MPAYDLLAIDLDGTLLSPDGSVSDANLAAVREARAGGIRTVVCTGRGLAECAHILRVITQHDPVVVAGGSIIACPRTGGTLHRSTVDRTLVRDTVDTLLSHNYPALVLKDPADAGYDYLVVRGSDNLPLDPVTRWWFSAMNVRVREARTLDEDPHPEHTVRVGACGPSSAMAMVRTRLAPVASDRAIIHHFPAVVAPEHASRQDGDVLHVLELFDLTANKWDAVSRLAREWNIAPARIAAIGDEVNDLSMIRAAGLGIAMGNAVPAVAAAAKRRTHPNDRDGVAHAVGRILSGEW